MTVQEYLRANLPPGWENKLCSSGKAFFEDRKNLPPSELFAQVRSNIHHGRHIRLLALWIFGDRAREAMYDAQNRAQSRPWTWDTTQAWGAEFLSDLNEGCLQLLETLL